MRHCSGRRTAWLTRAQDHLADVHRTLRRRLNSIAPASNTACGAARQWLAHAGRACPEQASLAAAGLRAGGTLDLHLRLRGGKSKSSAAAGRGAAGTAAPVGPETSPELAMMGLLVNDVVAHDRGEEVLAKVRRPDLALPGPARERRARG